MKTRIIFLCFGGLLLTFLTGCTFWDKPVSDSFASVTITNTTYADVQAVTIQLFSASDYKLVSIDTNTDMIVFEKEATHGQSFAYNGLLGTSSGESVIDRVKIVLRNDLGDDTFLLCCQAYIVQDTGGAIPPHEIPRSNMHNGPYQKILDDIARRLNPPDEKK
jgi:hypothetical protein